MSDSGPPGVLDSDEEEEEDYYYEDEDDDEELAYREYQQYKNHAKESSAERFISIHSTMHCVECDEDFHSLERDVVKCAMCERVLCDFCGANCIDCDRTWCMECKDLMNCENEFECARCKNRVCGECHDNTCSSCERYRHGKTCIKCILRTWVEPLTLLDMKWMVYNPKNQCQFECTRPEHSKHRTLINDMINLDVRIICQT